MADHTHHPVLVIGGGISGIVCALELQRLGVPVMVAEKEAAPGGLAARFCCKASEKCNKCFACVADKKLTELTGQPHIPLMTGAVITKVTGRDGGFRVSLTREGRASELDAAAIVVAAGIDPFDAAGKGEYGYGVLKNVVTARDLEDMLRQEGRIRRPSDGKVPKNIAFIQCVGSRDTSLGHPYCSHVCCAYALRLIRTLRHQYPDLSATFLYMDIQPAGASFHAFLKACREDPGLRLIRSLPSRVYHSPVTEDLRIRLADTERGEVVEEPFDMVVLSVGMVLAEEAKTLAGLLAIGVNEEGFLAVPPPEEGVFLTGACTGPKDIDLSIIHAKSTAASVHHFLQGR